jgi:N-acyl-L-homoserine lactone synthetase
LYVVRTLSTAAEIIASQQLRGQIYAGERGYLATTDLKSDGRDEDDFDAKAIHGGVFSLDGALLGSVRLIEAGDTPLPIATLYGITPARGDLEVSRLVVHPKYRHSVVTMALFHWVLWESIDRGVEGLLAILERPLLVSIQTVGFPFVALGEPRSVYPNSIDLPVRCEVADLLSGVRRADLRRTHKFLEFFENRLDRGRLPAAFALPES